MNIVFWFLIVLALVLIWFCLSSLFRGIGGIGITIFNDAIDTMKETDEGKEDSEDEV